MFFYKSEIETRPSRQSQCTRNESYVGLPALESLAATYNERQRKQVYRDRRMKLMHRGNAGMRKLLEREGGRREGRKEGRKEEGQGSDRGGREKARGMRDS